jgi:hypothetical protein
MNNRLICDHSFNEPLWCALFYFGVRRFIAAFRKGFPNSNRCSPMLPFGKQINIELFCAKHQVDHGFLNSTVSWRNVRGAIQGEKLHIP